MSEVRLEKISNLKTNGGGGLDIKFLITPSTSGGGGGPGTVEPEVPDQKLMLDENGNLCFHNGSAATDGPHITPPAGSSAMYCARAWGVLVTTGATAAAIDTDQSRSKNVIVTDDSSSPTKWRSPSQLQITFDTPMPNADYSVVANFTRTDGVNPRLVRKHPDSNAEILILEIFALDDSGEFTPSGIHSGTMDFVVFAGTTTVVAPEEYVELSAEEIAAEVAKAALDAEEAAVFAAQALAEAEAAARAAEEAAARAAAANSQPMARWNFVPHQVIDTERLTLSEDGEGVAVFVKQKFKIGVVAFHPFGIDRVEFFLDDASNTNPYGRRYFPATNITYDPRGVRLTPPFNFDGFTGGTTEYTIQIEAYDEFLSAGKHTLRASIYPINGLVRHLDLDPVEDFVNSQGLSRPRARANGNNYMSFIINKGGITFPRAERYVSPTLGSDITGTGNTLAPFETIGGAMRSIAGVCGGTASGGIINLLAGSHNYGCFDGTPVNTKDSWLTIRPAPGLASAACPITSGIDKIVDGVVVHKRGLETHNVKFENITFKPDASIADNGNNLLFGSSDSMAAKMWAEGCTFSAHADLSGISSTEVAIYRSFQDGWSHLYYTYCNLTECGDGFVDAELVRNCKIDNIVGNAYSGSGLVIDSTCRVINSGGVSYDSSFYQFRDTKWTENCIVFGATYGGHTTSLEASPAPGLYAGALAGGFESEDGISAGIKNIAFVEVVASSSSPKPVFELSCPVDNMLVQGCTLSGTASFRYDKGHTSKTITMRKNNLNGATGAFDINVDGIPGGVNTSEEIRYIRTNQPQVSVTKTPGTTAGPSAGTEAQAMARWNFVPHQILGVTFNVGVVAFHAYGIDRVEFFLDGATTATDVMHSRTFNPESDTNEYWMSVSPATLTPGPHTISATAYPIRGLPRHLNGDNIQTDLYGQRKMTFIADPLNTFPRLERYVSPTLGNDATGTGTVDSPFATMMKAARSIHTANGACADGGIINLMAGGHTYGQWTNQLTSVTNNTWLTIRPAPGVASADCPIERAALGLRLKLVKFQDITVKATSSVSPLLGHKGTVNWCAMWGDNCDLVGRGLTFDDQYYALWNMKFFTNSTAGNSRDGFRECEMLRNCRIDEISSDAFQMTPLVVNCSCRFISDAPSSEFHPDMHQFYSQGTLHSNAILYGVVLIDESQTQGLFTGDIGHPGIKDFAIVNVSAGVTSPWRVFQYHPPVNHMLIQNLNIRGSSQFRHDTNFVAKDVVLRNVTIDNQLAPLDTIYPSIDTTGNILYLPDTV